MRKLVFSCRADKVQVPNLYCIVLIGLTTGARKSEILNLTGMLSILTIALPISKTLRMDVRDELDW